MTYGGLTIGTFAGGSDGTVPLRIAFNSNADIAAIQELLRNISYENVSTNPDVNQRLIEFTITDGDGGVSDMVAKTVVVNSTNAAPVLNGANDLNSIGEDAVGNGATPVSALLAGQVSDADPAALNGIAVIGVDNSNGDWQYSIDNGTTWITFAAPDVNNARLLADTSLVRFVPDANWNGTVTKGITFHAWDQTDGVVGGATDITGAGNLADNFDAVSYSSNDGSTAWTSGWIEFSDDGNAAAGNIRV